VLQSTGVLVVLFVLLWNSGFISAEYGLPYAKPFTLLFWRYWGLALILWGSLTVTHRFEWPAIKQMSQALITGILAHGVWLSCVLIAIQRGVPAGIVALVVALQPLATGALSGIVVGEYPRSTQWLGLTLGFLGVVFVLSARSQVTDIEVGVAYFLPFISVMAITVASLLQRYLATRQTQAELSIDVSLFYQSLGTAIGVTLPAVLVEQLSTEWNGVFVGTLLWLILAVSLGAYGLMWMLIKRLDATRVASLFYLGPPVTMVMAWMAFGDTPQPTDYVGILVVAFGVGIAQR
jgi:drug/metabolite transporter (DMT)-like permease